MMTMECMISSASLDLRSPPPPEVEEEKNMTPLYTQTLQLVGWLDEEEKYVFDTNLTWVAFLSSDHVFSSAQAKWLGAFYGESTFQDRQGRPVAWLQNTQPLGDVAPSPPPAPPVPPPPPPPAPQIEPPFPPLKPMHHPFGGYSQLSWQEWLTQ